jgi:hydrogenase maturation protease
MAVDAKHPAIAIVGLGNELLMDDGVGVHAVRELQKAPPENVAVVEVGTRALAAQQILEDADIVIAIDAAHADGPAGSIYRFEADKIESDRLWSLHEMGIIGVLRLMPDESRPKVIILGVEPEVIDCGMYLSPVVKAALGRVVRVARRIVDEIGETGILLANAG